MEKLSILSEAHRLYNLGFAIIWLKPKSKKPVESGWTKGPRKTWEELNKTYKKGYNVGVRLGAPSKIKEGFLTVVDIDIKTFDTKIFKEAIKKAKDIIGSKTGGMVRSGGGKGSRHYYCLSKEEPKTIHLKNENYGIDILGTGAQVVLPPSIHPLTGKSYEWGQPVYDLDDIPVISDLKKFSNKKKILESKNILEDFKVEPVELHWLDISDELKNAIIYGKDVQDRSAFLLKTVSSLFKEGLSQNEILTILTDPKNFLGKCGYDHAQTNSRKKAAEWVYKYTFKKIKEEQIGPEIFKKFPLPDSWQDNLIRSKDGNIVKNVQNMVTILTQEMGQNVIKRDTFSYRDIYDRDTPWGGKKKALVNDEDVIMIKYWLSQNYKIEPQDKIISDALVVIAQKNSFDPVKEAIEALPPWDGVKRLDSWLIRNFNAEGDPEYLAQVFRKWIVAMIMRCYIPGAKFDWMPIFEGKQGIGKSSIGRLLVGDKYFLDWLPNLNDKDSMLSLQGMWAVELGELAHFSHNKLENIKAFVVRTVDKFRLPYGRRAIESPRRCVFFGTTNKEAYLIDETGNRRFKPVKVGLLNFKALRDERSQLFAEAKYLWDEKIETQFTMELTGKAKIFEDKIHAEKMIPDDSETMKEFMLDFIEKVQKNRVNFDLKKFRATDLFLGGTTSSGPFVGWQKSTKNLMYAGKMLKKLNATQKKINGIKYWSIDLFPENL